MSNLVKRLRDWHWREGGTRVIVNPDGPEAADRIEALEAEVERLRATLKKAEARAERLRAALVEIRDADSNLGPMYDWADEKFQAVKEIAREALEDSE